MSAGSAIEGFFKGLFTKAKIDVEAEIASPNWAALHTIAFVALALFLVLGTLALDAVKLGYLVHTVWLFMIVHPAYKLGIAFLNAFKGTSVHSDKATVAVAATSPGAPAAIVPPASLPAKSP